MTDKTIRILLIEDDPGDIKILRQQLSNYKEAAFSFAAEGLLSEGLARLTRENFDVVLLDLSLPDGRGVQAVTRLHQALPAMPILATNVVDNESLALESVREGAQDFYVKGEGGQESLGRMILLALERKKIERGLARLALFAWKNPNVIIEHDLEGKVVYLNPAGRQFFPDLAQPGASHPFLDGIVSLIETLKQEGRESVVREVEIQGSFYEQHVWFVPESGLVHSYIVDNTERIKALEDLKKRTHEVERMNRVMIGREIKMKALKEKIRNLETRAA